MSTTSLPGWPYDESPFHRGELAVQERVGIRRQLDGPARRGIRNYPPEQHRRFFAQLPFLVVGSADGGANSRQRGVDVSHRGGKPGFVRIDDAQTLTVPDFVGNFFFNTIGNLQVNPRAGLLFIDFTRGDLLYLAVEAEIIWDGEAVRAFAGAERLLRFRIREALRVEGSLPLRWGAATPSPFLERMGAWA